MLTTDPKEKYGKTTLREHYQRVATEGQEYDPYTSVFGSKQTKEDFKKKDEEEEGFKLPFDLKLPF